MEWGAALLITVLGASSPARSTPPALYTELGSRAPGPLPDLSRLARAAMPAVVGVVTTQAKESAKPPDAMKDLFDHFHGESPKKGLGTGFMIHKDGYLLTNAHVVEGADHIEVDVGDDDDSYPAKLVGTDDASDVALLKIEGTGPFPVIPLGDSDRVDIAEWVMVIGNPFGLSHSVTLGIISHTGRGDIAPAGRDGYYDFIQTDASINPGNSGGPLVNLQGEVIGIATAINATGQGIGFAIPINMAKEIVGQLKQHGRVVRSWMGVSVQEVPRNGARRLPGAPPPRGVLVTDVVAGSPASQSGLKVGDVITSFDGHAVRNPSRLRWYVSTAGVGRSVALTVSRGAVGEQAVQVELGSLPPRAAAARPAVPPSEPGPAAQAPDVGSSEN